MVVTARVETADGLYVLKFCSFKTGEKALVTCSNEDYTRKWHQWLGHPGEEHLRKTLAVVEDVPIRPVGPVGHFEACVEGNSSRAPRKSKEASRLHSDDILELFHSEVMGPMKVSSLSGSRYADTVYEDKSSLSLLPFLKKRGDLLKSVKKMISELERSRASVSRSSESTKGENIWPNSSILG
eukprot:gb/GEZJ01003957.1/.p1 GENE.gb/GEZJ01003957.1/~~gb/GEZJ01003957.1/.p1  ORF type:complete len:183 (-),score=23.99 gb/GEZJ01003957.1/:750-1298(-)